MQLKCEDVPFIYMKVLTKIITEMITAILILVSLKYVALAKAENVESTSASTISLVKGSENSTIIPILLPDYKRHQNSLRSVTFMKFKNDNEIDWETVFKKCRGVNSLECPENISPSQINDTRDKLENSRSNLSDISGKNPQTSPPMINYMNSSTKCRCDEKCVKYGDCCSSVLKKLRKVPKDLYYRCSKLLDSIHSVRMISICPSRHPKDINRNLCEHPECPSKDFNVNHASLCPLLDVPVLNNKTGELYRNIFCARCHSVSNRDIHPTNRTLYCTNFTSRTEWDEFKRTAIYQPGELRWSDPTNSSVNCKLYIRDLQPNVIKTLIPHVRFCNSLGREECITDLTKEENQLMHNLCFSYTQIVYLPNKESFKNPHCAKCQHPDMEFGQMKCLKENSRAGGFAHINGRLVPHETGPVGINILFHFSLDMDDGFVGYTSKCDGDEILDFISNKCVPAICPNGYAFRDGQCELDINDENSSSDPSPVNISTPLILPRGTINSSNTSTASNSSKPCLLIFLHAGEYHQLANGSLTVNKSGDSEGLIMFHPGEYEKHNESSMSICAENVEKTFESSFGPALSYISNILLALSVLCSMIHVVIFIILPKMRNLPGNNLLCLTTSLLISQLIFLTLIKAKDKTVCVVASITMHYLFLASFCWMNIMSFDIWRTFSSEFIVRRYSGDSLRTFLKYSLFAWVTPLLIVILSIITDFYLPDSLLNDQDFGPLLKKLRPLYGHNNLCWIGQRLSLFVFFAFPVALIIFCNLILFTLTATTIWIQNKEGNKFINGSRSGSDTKGSRKDDMSMDATANSTSSNGNNKLRLRVRNSGSTKKSDRIRFKLYAKLALIMGLTWILGFLSGFTQWQWLWYPFVIFNGLQGTFIFVAFDCKTKIWNMIVEKCTSRKRKTRGRMRAENMSDLKRRDTTTTTSSTLGRSRSTTRTFSTTVGGSDSDSKKI